MKYSENVIPEQKGIEINVAKIFKTLLKRWWILFLVAVVGGCSGFAYAQITKTPQFSSSLSFVVSNKENGEVFSSSDMAASIKMANTYQYILSGKTLSNMVANKCSFDTTAMEIRNSMEVTSVTDSNIIEMKITTDDQNTAYEIAKIISDNYSTVVESAGFTKSALNICEMPEIAKGPNSDNSAIKNAIVGVFSFMFIAIAVIVILDLMKDTIQSVEDIQNKLDLNVLGVITQIDDSKVHKADDSKHLLVSEKNIGFSFVETFKAIRTKIESVSAKNGYKTFVISSAGENEGKTTISANVAITLAQNGHSVLLIDADLRKPSVNHILGIPNAKGKGLHDVINATTTIENAVKYVEKYKLFLLAGNSGSSDSAELLSSPQLESIIQTAEKEFDFIIIDTAPASVVTDASVIAKSADAVLLVIREDTMPVSRVKMAISDLSDSGSDIIGCVYNNVSYSNGGFYGTYRYASRKYEYGNYGAHYGYGKKSGYIDGYYGESKDTTPENRKKK